MCLIIDLQYYTFSCRMIYNYNLAFIDYYQGTRQYNNIVLIAFGF